MVSKALIELRRRGFQTQQSMANCLGCSLQTIARWETVSEPQGYTLHMLLSLARCEQWDDLAAIFQAALDKFKLVDRRRAEEIEADVKCWGEIDELLMQVEDEAAMLGDPTHLGFKEVTDVEVYKAACKQIQEQVTKLMRLADQTKRLAWRN